MTILILFPPYADISFAGGGRGDVKMGIDSRERAYLPKVLHEIADGTGDFFVFVEGERYDGLFFVVVSSFALQVALLFLDRPGVFLSLGG